MARVNLNLLSSPSADTPTMKSTDLKRLTVEQLNKKAKGTKHLIWILIPLILFLSYFNIHDYISKKEIDLALLIITICSLGGLASLVPELKQTKQELNSRR